MRRTLGAASLFTAALAVTGCGEILGIRVYDDDTQDGASAADSSASDRSVTGSPSTDAAAQDDADAASDAAGLDAHPDADATAESLASAEANAVPDVDAAAMPQDGASVDGPRQAAGDGSVFNDGAGADSSPTARSCKDACTVGSAQCSTDNASVEKCQAGADGCTTWAASASCGSHQTCGVKAGSPACACNPSVCTKTGAVCRDAQTVATCATDANACPYVASTTACISPQSCSGSAPSAMCALTCTSSCTQGETACVSEGLATCTLGANGCWAYAPPSPCGTRQSCVGNAGAAACTCDTDPVCTSLGNACATSSTLASCAEDAQGCFYQASVMACTGGETCQGGACACSTGQTDCNGTCTRVTTDSGNCGACGHNCQGGACLNGQCQPALVASGFVSGDIAVGPDSVYVVDSGSGGRLLRITKAGGTITALASGNIWDTAVFGTSLYWTTSTAGGTDGRVTQAALDGSSPVDIATGQATASSLFVDASGVYWMVGNTPLGTIMRLGPTDLAPFAFAPNLPGPSSMTGDPNNIYLLTGGVIGDGSDGAVYAIPKNGGSLVLIVPIQHNATGTGLSIAVFDEIVYWDPRGLGDTDGAVRSAPPLAAAPVIEYANNQVRPQGIAVDGSFVYWIDAGSGSDGLLQKASLTTHVVTQLAGGLASPGALRLDGSVLYFATQGNATTAGGLYRFVP